MPKFPVPESNVEWPEWQYREFPAFVGLDAEGKELIAQNADEVKDLQKRKVYPKVIGKNRDGNDVIALNADEERLKQSQVDPEKSASALSGKTSNKPGKE